MSLEPKILFYTKPNCPLCDKAKNDLKRLARKIPHQLIETDITQNDDLFAKYRYLIPVGELVSSGDHANEVLFSYRVDAKKIAACIKNQAKK
jgi:hypothetical protein